MPVHKVGYRKWTGGKTPGWSRWWIITATGLKIALKAAWIRRMLLICWLPVLYWGLGLFFIEQAINLDQNGLANDLFAEFADPEQRELIEQFGVEQAEISEKLRREMVLQLTDQLRMLPDREALKESLLSADRETMRHSIWTWLLMTFFLYPQGLAILFLIGFIVPALISQDVRSRAFLLYFSRPIGLWEYIVGKALVPIIFVAMITTIPGICLYFFGISLSPDIAVLKWTWDIPLRILAASVVVIAPTCAMALMFSSVTQESRFATFAWFSVWALGHAAWFAIATTQSIRLQEEPFSDQVMNDPIVNRWAVVSLYNNLSAVQSWIFGFRKFDEVCWPLIVLVALTVFSLLVLCRGVSASLRT
jgi:hypothetical protein